MSHKALILVIPSLRRAASNRVLPLSQRATCRSPSERYYFGPFRPSSSAFWCVPYLNWKSVATNLVIKKKVDTVVISHGRKWHQTARRRDQDCVAEGWMEVSVLGSPGNLQIHHKEFRSQSWDDTEQNLNALLVTMVCTEAAAERRGTAERSAGQNSLHLLHRGLTRSAGFRYQGRPRLARGHAAG
jgi:hypothetical protein